MGGTLAAFGSFDDILPLNAAGRAEAGDAEIPYGAAVKTELLDVDVQYTDAIKRYCRMIVGEGGLKWADLRPQPETFDFTQADRQLEFADANGMTMRGHTLVWYAAMPDWALNLATPLAAELELVNHIETVLDRYRGRIPSWDVVNEPIADDPSGRDVIRPSVWSEQLGRGYIETSLRTAAEADPNAQLIINDFNFEKPTTQCRRRRAAMIDLLRELKDNGVPLHGLGLQGHLTGASEIDQDGLSRFVEDVNELELDVLVTELDVIDDKLPGNVHVRDQIVASRVKDYLDAITDVVQPKAILTWGISDRYTWVPMWFSRSDGLPNRPLPLDDKYQPKALFSVLQQYTSI